MINVEDRAARCRMARGIIIDNSKGHFHGRSLLSDLFVS